MWLANAVADHVSNPPPLCYPPYHTCMSSAWEHFEKLLIRSLEYAWFALIDTAIPHLVQLLGIVMTRVPFVAPVML
jgi:hypothetical protein